MNHCKSTDAVSPVLSVILVLGVTVLVSGIVGVFVFDVSNSVGVSNSGVADTTFSMSEDTGEVKLTTQTGTADRVEVRVDGEVAETLDDATAGDTITLSNLRRGAEITIVEVDGESESVRGSFTVTDGAEGSFSNEPSMSAPSDVSNVAFTRGDGTESNPYVIMNDHQLQAMSSELDAHYVLGQNIELSGTSSWNGGAGFEPIGSSTSQFTGTFDGNGYVINNLTINRPNMYYVGLFSITTNAVVSDVRLENSSVRGDQRVGTLVGRSDETVFTGVSSHGSVTGNGWNGGIIGRGYDISIENSYSEVDVTGNNGAQQVGGVAGEINDGTVDTVYSTGNVTGSSMNIGGLIGTSSAVIQNSYATGSVTGDSSVGGLVGTSKEDIRSSYATGEVTGTGEYVGGVVGWSRSITIRDSHATGTVTGDTDVGGLIGFNRYSYVFESYANGSVSGNTRVGGLVGHAFNTYSTDRYINDTYATGSVSGDTTVGGLIGKTEGTIISRSYASGHVDSSGSSVGGVIGENVESSEYISNVYWMDDGFGDATQIVGSGLSSSSSQVTGTSSPSLDDARGSGSVDILSYLDDSVWVDGDAGEYPRLK